MVRVLIEDLQEKVEVDETLHKNIEKAVKAALKYEDFKKKCEVYVSLVDNEQIKEYNNQYRDIDKETDVLSFPMVDFNVEQDDQYDYNRGYLMLGDIIISVEKAIEQAEDYGHSFERETGFLCVHSTLHLLGYDHDNDENTKIMRQKEEEILSSIKLTR